MTFLKRLEFASLLGSLAVVALALPQRPAVYKGKEEKLPLEVAPQPVAFSHKKHSALGMGCLDCHVDAKEKDQASLPDAERCMACHRTVESEHPEVKKLAELHRRGEKIRWVRVYRVPDFVFFSHANHLKAGERCATCHGPVEQRDVLAREISTSMVACMNCHASRNASNECSLCHQLSH